MLAVAFHAECLHEDLVWDRTHAMARWMNEKGFRATFFVFPHRAVVVGRDVRDRVKQLANLNHEIGQHTHFYASDVTEGPGKRNDLSPGNIARCLGRDLEVLRSAGIRPRGFTAGAWLVDSEVLTQLLAFGFEYDCSSRFPNLQLRGSDLAHRMWLSKPSFFGNPEESQLVLLPTTGSLGEWWRQGWRWHTPTTPPYQLIYLHDYDLLRPARTHLLKLLLRLKTQSCTAGDLASMWRAPDIR